ncbi:MAG TPA: HupE/UreJ family protein [Longimicrobiales bacterium]|nr:HupE/UreJ family protein [Longimicrobiales bacterium]
MDPTGFPHGLTWWRGTARPCRASPGAAAAVVLALLVVPSPAAAHEIPATVTVRVLVQPEGDRLRVLLRVPVAALRDVDLPVRGPGRYLALPEALPRLRDAARLWLVDYLEVRERGRVVGPPALTAVRVSLPTDRSFGSWDGALAHVSGPGLPEGTELVPEQALLDVLLDYPIASAGRDLALVPALAHLGVRTTTVLRYRTPDGRDRVLRYTGDPGLVRLDPRWHHAALRFVALGFEHILDGLDHLLFLLVLVVPFRRIRPLVPVVTAFTVAHSITLAASALGLAPRALWFPPLVEALIALSIVWLALENIVGARVHRRWAAAFGFGLVHGFGFSFALAESLQFAGGHLLTSLLAFNVGVELGQLLVLAVMVPLLGLLFRRVVAERMGTIIVSALVAHSGWHWMTTRGSELLQYDVRWPAPDLLLAAAALRWATLALVVLAAAWLTRALFRRLGASVPGSMEPSRRTLDPFPGET